MTKEALLFTVLNKNIDKVDKNGAVHTDVMLEAMSQYAKEKAIDFAKWLDNRRLEKAVERQKRIMKEGRQLEWKTELPNEELYELYLKTLDK